MTEKKPLTAQERLELVLKKRAERAAENPEVNSAPAQKAKTAATKHKKALSQA